MKIHLVLLALLFAGCSLSHRDPFDDPFDDASLDPDAGAPDAPDAGAPAAPDAGAPDAGPPDAGPPRDAGPLLDCAPPLIPEDELCVGWRVIAPPPCEAFALVRVDGRVGVECGTATYVVVDDAWSATTAPGEPIPPATARPPDTFFGDYLIVAELPDGSAVATHNDLYALPAAWRTGPGGVWRETRPPPGSFVNVGAALSDDEALFVGQEAFVFVGSPR